MSNLLNFLLTDDFDFYQCTNFLTNDICSFVRIFGVFIYQIVREFCKLYHAGISACDYENFNEKNMFPLLMETNATKLLDIC